MCAYRQTLYHGTECASGGADLSDDSDIRQWVVALYFAMTTVTTVGYGDITAHSTVEQVSFAVSLEKKRKDYAFRRQFNEKPSTIPGCPGAISLCSCNMHSYSAVEHVSCATMAVLREHAQHLLLPLWGRQDL